MEIITQDKREEFLKYIRSIRDKHIVGTIDSAGTLHDGHLRIFQDVKKHCEILVVENEEFYTRACLYYRNGHPELYNTLFEKSVEKLKEIENDIDYVIFSSMTQDIWKSTIENEIKYRKEFEKLHKNLGLSNTMNLSLAYSIHSDVHDSCTQAFSGSKNIIHDIVMRKVIPPNELTFNPETIWKIYRHPDTGQAFARTSSNVVLGYMASKVAEELKAGNFSTETFQEIHRSYFLEKPEFSIVDLETCEKLNKVKDNCVIVIADGLQQEFVIMKDGELIF